MREPREIFDIPLITFSKGERKDDIAKERFARFESEEEVVFMGKAQEKTPLLRPPSGAIRKPVAAMRG